MIVTLLKTSLPDVHRIIFDFHTELAYRKVRDNVAKLAGNEYAGLDGPTSMIFYHMVKVAQDAIDIGKIVYHEAHRPQINIYEEIVGANEKFIEANQRVWALEVADRTPTMFSDQYTAYCGLVEARKRLTIN